MDVDDRYDGVDTEIKIDPIPCGEHCFDVQFHPMESVVAAAIITGHVEL
jgi:hypothetical protein